MVEINTTMNMKSVELVCWEIETRLSVQKPTKQSDKLLNLLLLPFAVHDFNSTYSAQRNESSFVRILFKVIGGKADGNRIKEAKIRNKI